MSLRAALAGAAFGAALVARRAVLIPLSTDSEAPSFFAAVPSPGWFLLGSLAGVVVFALLARYVPARVFYPLAVPGLALLPLVPVTTTLVPALASFSGPVLDLVLLGSLAISLLRLAEAKAFSIGASARQVAVAAFLLYLGIGGQLQKEVGLSGDEPHYLVILESILKDGDLRVDDNYARGDWQEFYSGKIRAHLAQPGRRGALYSIHGVGLPLLLLPGFALFRLKGVLVTEALLGALLVHETFRAAERLTERRSAGLVAAIVLGATAPAIPLATMAYPELPAAAVVVLVFRRLLDDRAPRGFGWGLLLGLLPFLHMKFLAVSFVLEVAMIWRFRHKRVALVAGWVLGAAALALFYGALFGSPNPLAAYGRQRLFPELVPLGLAGLLFDQEFGLLPVAPVYAVALFGLGRALRGGRFAAFVAAAVLLSVAIPGAAHPLWYGGASPPARFLFPALPLLAVFAGAAWIERHRALLVMSVLLGLTLAFGPSQPLYLNQKDGTGRIWEAIGTSWELTRYLPSLVVGDPRSFGLAVLAALLSGLAAAPRTAGRAPFSLAALGAAFLIDSFAPVRASPDADARFKAALLKKLPELRGRGVSVEAVLPQMSLPLEAPPRGPLGEDESEPGPWESVPFFIPAGEYLIEGELPPAALLCNGESCFAPALSVPFHTGLALSRFHVRAPGTRNPSLRLALRNVDAPGLVAERSSSLGAAARLHFIDANAFYEPEGFWVKSKQGTALAVESEGDARIEWSLTNGGAENWVELRHPGGRFRFKLRPFEQRRVVTPVAPGVSPVTIESGSGFTPASGSDRRQLGLFVSASRF